MKHKTRIAPEGEKKRCFTCRYNRIKLLENVTFGGVYPVTGSCELSGRYITFQMTCDGWACFKLLEQAPSITNTKGKTDEENQEMDCELH